MGQDRIAEQQNEERGSAASPGQLPPARANYSPSLRAVSLTAKPSILRPVFHQIIKIQ
jgi:hypothetical protein